MLSRCTGKGDNPYCVNVFTFSLHGFTFDGDAIAVIPELESEDSETVSFTHLYINFIACSSLHKCFCTRQVSCWEELHT